MHARHWCMCARVSYCCFHGVLTIPKWRADIHQSRTNSLPGQYGSVYVHIWSPEIYWTRAHKHTDHPLLCTDHCVHVCIFLCGNFLRSTFFYLNLCYCEGTVFSTGTYTVIKRCRQCLLIKNILALYPVGYYVVFFITIISEVDSKQGTFIYPITIYITKCDEKRNTPQLCCQVCIFSMTLRLLNQLIA